MVPICGIAGFSLSKTERLNSRRLAKLLAVNIQHRGRQATGVAWVTREGDLQIEKKPQLAEDFVKDLSMWKRTDTCLIHTRQPTGGSIHTPANNHPIRSGHIVGVHNGFLSNDDSLFRGMGIPDRRVGEVDSEAIFAAIAWGLELAPSDNLPRIGKDAKDLTDVFARIDGVAAVGWIDTSDDIRNLHLARINSNPIAIGETEAGSLIFASEATAISEACDEMGITLAREYMLNEGVWVQVKRGKLENWREFEVPERWGYSRSYVSSGDFSGGGLSKGTGRSPLSSATKSTAGTSKSNSATYQFKNGVWVPREPYIIKGGTHQSAVFRLKDGYIPVVETLTKDVTYDHDVCTPLYRARDKAIEEVRDEYISRAEEFGVTEFGVDGELIEWGADLTVGAWVHVNFPGKNDTMVAAEVVLMPQTFPEGTYVLKAWVTNEDAVLMHATYDDFIVWKAPVASLPAPEVTEDNDDTVAVAEFTTSATGQLTLV